MPINDTGATAVEYCLIAVFIAAVIVGVVAVLGQNVLHDFSAATGF
jgi:Flp pilus assembly pilin Flp